MQIEATFTKTEKNNEWNFNFLQKSPFCYSNTFFREFSFGCHISETSFMTWREPAILYFLLCFYGNRFHLWDEKNRTANERCCTCNIQCFTKIANEYLLRLLFRKWRELALHRHHNYISYSAVLISSFKFKSLLSFSVYQLLMSYLMATSVCCRVFLGGVLGGVTFF